MAKCEIVKETISDKGTGTRYTTTRTKCGVQVLRYTAYHLFSSQEWKYCPYCGKKLNR